MRFCLPQILILSLLCLSGCDWKKEKNTSPKPPPKPKEEKRIVFKTPEKKEEVKVKPQRITIKECESNDMSLDDFSDADIVAVMVYADWCPYSQEYSPILEGFTKQGAYKFAVLRVNADALPELARQLDVSALPKTMFYIKGRRVGEFVGSIREDKLGLILDNLMKNNAPEEQNTPTSPAENTSPLPTPTQPRLRSTL